MGARCCFGLLLSLLAEIALGQELREPLSLSVSASSTARSPVFELTPAEELVVALAESSTVDAPNLRLFVHRDAGNLVGLDDPDTSLPEFTWRTSTEGLFYVMAQNGGPEPVSLTIRRVGVRGPTPPPATHGVVRVYYVTDRSQSVVDSGLAFGADPGLVMYGRVDVSIPRDHRMGEVEGPSLLRLQFRQDSSKHVVSGEPHPRSRPSMFKELQQAVERSIDRRCLVFVHGYNVSFTDALKRAGQIAYDLALDGPIVLYSWPSDASLSQYLKDVRNADLSAKNLRDFISQVGHDVPGIVLNILAHSMGNRVLTRALEQGGTGQGSGTSPLAEVALLAPDVDAALFRQNAANLTARATRVTLYASDADRALKASKGLARYPRAGDAGKGIVVVAGVQTIDASNIATSMFGLNHSYYGDNSTVLADMFQLFRGKPITDRFGLREVRGKGYWQFVARNPN